MSAKSEALRLAEILEDGSRQFNAEAAAELRRLHAENERVFKLADDQDSVIRRQRTERQTLEAQRDALLEALKLIDKEFKKHGRHHWPEAVKARAAIAQTEGA